MLRLPHAAQALLFAIGIIAAAKPIAAQPQAPSHNVEAILKEVRKATGGAAWNRVAELRVDGTLLVAGKTGTIAIADDLRTGANADRVTINGQQVENHVDAPTQDWEQDAAWEPDSTGDVLLTPGGKEPAEIDDLYIHRNGWWEPGFGGATVTLLSPATEDGVTYDLIECKVPGGKGFTLWIDRGAHHIDRIAAGSSATVFSDFRRTPGGLVLPFRQQKGAGASAILVTTTKLVALPSRNEADFQPPFHTDYTMPASGQVTVPAEGGLIFKMKVNGQRPFRTVFDTGAVNVMSADFAKRLGLQMQAAPVPYGAGGGSITAHFAHVDTLAIGDLIVRNQIFHVLDLPTNSGDPEMLVGWEMMRRFAVRVDFKHSHLTFFDGPHFHYTGTGDAVPLVLSKQGNGAVFRAEADGIAGDFLLDTGNQVGLGLNSGFVNEHHFVATLGAHYRGYNGRGFGGDSPQAWLARLHTLRIGNSVISDPVVRLETAPDYRSGDAGNIGQSVLDRFTLTVDCMRGVLYLEKNADWNKREVFNRAGLIFDPVDGVDTVKTVLPGSPGDLAGLKSGDRITAIDGHVPADDPNDPTFTKPVGTVVRLTIERDGATKVYAIGLKDML